VSPVLVPPRALVQHTLKFFQCQFTTRVPLADIRCDGRMKRL
jgi:hypothetical protein